MSSRCVLRCVIWGKILDCADVRYGMTQDGLRVRVSLIQ